MFNDLLFTLMASLIVALKMLLILMLAVVLIGWAVTTIYGFFGDHS